MQTTCKYSCENLVFPFRKNFVKTCDLCAVYYLVELKTLLEMDRKRSRQQTHMPSHGIASCLNIFQLVYNVLNTEKKIFSLFIVHQIIVLNFSLALLNDSFA